jgi:hypothetical protein
VRAFQRETCPRVIERDARPGVDAMAGRTRAESRGFAAMRISMAIRACGECQPEVVLRVTRVARHREMRAGQRELRALVLFDTERRWQESFDRMAPRAIAFQLTLVRIAMAAAALIEARELQCASFRRVTRIALGNAMCAAQRKACFVVIERSYVREAGRGVAALA